MSPPLQILVDVGVGKAVEDWLRQAGHDVRTVRERDPRMEDTDILAWAFSEQRLLITMDKDFGELVYHSGQPHAGVLLLRMADALSTEKVAAVEFITANYGDQLAGRFSVYQDGRLRIR